MPVPLPGLPLSLAISALLSGATQAAPPGGDRPGGSSRKGVRLIIHADDAGMCHSENQATMEALEKGIVTSASIMVPCPWFPEMAEWARGHPKADLGLHLTLTSEWGGYRWGPTAPKDRVPGLVAPDGCFWPSVKEAASHASAKEVETELRAQIEKALHAGLHPSHLDTHMGTVYARDDFFRVYLRLSREYRIPCMVIRPTPDALRLMDEHGVHLSPETLKSVSRLRQPLLDMLITGVHSAEFAARRAEWYAVLSGLRLGVTQIIIHVARKTPEIQAITHNWRTRWNDYRIFTDPATRRYLVQHGIVLTTWRELARETESATP